MMYGYVFLNVNSYIDLIQTFFNDLNCCLITDKIGAIQKFKFTVYNDHKIVKQKYSR